MKMYNFLFRTQLGWECEYPHYETDADAMMAARRQLQNRDDAVMVSVYLHEDDDTCGIKKFVVAYDK